MIVLTEATTSSSIRDSFANLALQVKVGPADATLLLRVRIVGIEVNFTFYGLLGHFLGNRLKVEVVAHNAVHEENVEATRPFVLVHDALHRILALLIVLQLLLFSLGGHVAGGRFADFRVTQHDVLE